MNVQLSLPQALKEAYAAQARGDYAATAKFALAILKAEPRAHAAHHLMAIVLHHKADVDGAIKALRRASTLAPRNGLYLSNLCEMLRQSGQLDQAVACGQRAALHAPGLVAAHCNLGIALYDQKNYDEAEASQLRAIAVDPNAARALNNLGSIALKREDLALSETFYRRAVAADATYTEGLCNLATVLVDREKPQEALDLLRPREAQCRNNPEWHRAMARAWLALDNLDPAEMGFRTAMVLKPGVAASHLGLAEVLYKKNQSELSLVEAKRAQELDPNSAAALYQVGQCEADLGRIDTARALFGRAIAIEPKGIGALIARGHLAMEMGDTDAAKADFAAARLAKPDFVGALLAELKLRKIKPDDPDLAELEQHNAQMGNVLPDKACAMLYALGKCYDDLGRYDAAFAAFAQGAALKRAKVKYSADAYDAAIDQVIATFDRSALDRLRGEALPDQRAIFVIGMPRSGTTMTESILASHPDVVGAGELPFLPRLLPMMATDTSPPVHGLIKGAPAEVARRFVDYLSASAENTATHPHFTDKMPCNFQYAGLIHALLPNARIIHVMRDPVDTCLSNFTRLFDRSQYHSYDLVELGRYYRAYQRVMDHWAQVLPSDAIHHVRYEDLVDDTEGNARKMLAACGLEWTDACLRFQDQKRRVRTASVTQVREAVYTTSVQKWRKYERHLTPLLQTLGPLVQTS